jgi:hypothetical protein
VFSYTLQIYLVVKDNSRMTFVLRFDLNVTERRQGRFYKKTPWPESASDL